MQQLIYHTKKIILLLVALQVMNVGLFAQNTTNDNDVESDETICSVTEYVAEVVLNQENAFHQTKKNHTHKHHKSHNSSHIKNHPIKLFSSITHNNFGHFMAVTTKQNFLVTNTTAYAKAVFDITAPPPKA